MPVRCSRCRRLDLVCKTASRSESCGQCVSACHTGCNVHGNDPSQLRAVLEEKKRLDQEKQETLAKLLRLEAQERRLTSRAEELFGHEIDILQEEERTSQVHAPPPILLPLESRVLEGGYPQLSFAAASTSNWLAGVDWSSVDPDLLLGQADLGSVGGTAGASPGSSGTREVPMS